MIATPESIRLSRHWNRHLNQSLHYPKASIAFTKKHAHLALIQHLYEFYIIRLYIESFIKAPRFIMSGFTIEQVTSLQVMIAASVKTSINNAITQAIATATINFEIKFVPANNQITTSRNVTLSTISITSISFASQPQSQQQSIQRAQSDLSKQSQQKKKRNEKTRQQYKRRTLQQTNTEIITENIAEKESISNSDSKVSSIKTTGLLSAIPVITSWFLQPYHYTMLVSPLAYIRFAEDMEITGQG